MHGSIYEYADRSVCHHRNGTIVFSQDFPQELSNLQLLLSRCIIIPMDNDIKNKAILIRRAYGTKLPDAIVAATSICNHLPLLTADKGFKRIEGLDLNLLELLEV